MADHYIEYNQIEIGSIIERMKIHENIFVFRNGCQLRLINVENGVPLLEKLSPTGQFLGFKYYTLGVERRIAVWLQGIKSTK